ncbi:MAG: S41 family peptidase [Ginsengibacter sp.]|jgi:C-terminal processing protease CtpA/Prc
MYRYLSLLLIPFIFSCAASKHYNPNKKYPSEELQQDFTLLRNVLEEKHPTLYWYTSKDSMDYLFNHGFQSISDSMTELQFGWEVLAPVLGGIRCGHTGFGMSKDWNRFIKDRQIPSFPFFLKVWKDTMMVIGNLNRNDTMIKRGDFVHAINGVSSKEIIAKMFSYMIKDGYADNVNYIRLSNNFPYFHRNIFGLFQNYSVNYSDSNGIFKNQVVSYYFPKSDTNSAKIQIETRKEITPTRQQKLEQIRSLKIDSLYAVMTINSFSKGKLRTFFRRSFKEIRKKNIQQLIIDIRQNGGGEIKNYVLLTKYLRNTPFKVADSAYSVAKNFSPFTKKVSNGFFNNISLIFLSKKEKDKMYHFGYWEKKEFSPKRRNHFDGKTYLLTDGLTFSAAALFSNALKGQNNVTLVGEETGGGQYGNSGIIIPTLTLPQTHLRVRLPFFKLVQFQHGEKNGQGVLPDIEVNTNWRDVLNRVDTKMETVKKLIKENVVTNY